MVGQILGNRYELVEKIGGGGMALVYKAKCKLLNRYVAVKILRTEFINDEEFIKRFRIEAQAAASLSHPNIVSIYDVGSDNDIHYIVMEYVDGVTLKEYVADKGKLGWKESVNIAIQICSALDNAHKNNIIHRDIKPHNILMPKDGVVKVTDFGIARAVSSSTMTMVGSTIGSVHYFSPEQARGGYTDEKSDLYSIGITLYEMVTGRLPFDGDTPVAVALKHLQDHAVPPIEINPNIPQSINDIIMKAIRKEQNKRYQSASEMLVDLKMVLVSPGMSITEESSENSPTRRMPVINKSDYILRDEEDMAKKGNNGEIEKNKRIKGIIAVSAISLAVVLIFGFIAYRLLTPKQTPEFIVQNYVGQKKSDVEKELIKNKIEVLTTPVVSDKEHKDIVIAQNPGPGRGLKIDGYDSAVILEVGKGPDLVKMLDVRKLDVKDAEIRLKEKGFTVRYEEENHDTIAVDCVVKTDPEPNDEVELGSVVTLYKSLGPKIITVKVPNLVGKTYADAQKLITEAKLSVGSTTPDGSNRIDKIKSQDPKSDETVKEGTPVNIIFEEPVVTPEPKRTDVQKILTLDNPEKYKKDEKIKVLIKSLPSDTKKNETILDEEKEKSDFPLKVTIPVPKNGNTTVTVFYNGVYGGDFKLP